MGSNSPTITFPLVSLTKRKKRREIKKTKQNVKHIKVIFGIEKKKIYFKGGRKQINNGGVNGKRRGTANIIFESFLQLDNGRYSFFINLKCGKILFIRLLLPSAGIKNTYALHMKREEKSHMSRKRKLKEGSFKEHKLEALAYLKEIAQ